jgi:hypothetical protein
MAKKGIRPMASHLLSIEPLEDRLLLTGLYLTPTAASVSPTQDAKTASSDTWQPDATASDTAAPQQSDPDAAQYQTPSQPTSYAATTTADGSASYAPAASTTPTYAQSGGSQTGPQPTGPVYYPANPKLASAATLAQQQAAVQIAQAYEQYCMILANAAAAAKTPLAEQRTTESTTKQGEQAPTQVRSVEQQPQGAGVRMADLPPPATSAAPEVARHGPVADILVLSPGMPEGRVSEPADGLAMVSQPEESTSLPPLGELLAGRLPLDLPALRQRVQQFFEHLGSLGEDVAAAPMGFRLAPWFVAVAVATSACEIARRQMRKQLWHGSITGLDPASQTWTWFPDPSGPPRGEVV